MDEAFMVSGVENLFIADASVIEEMLPGGPSASIIEQGMRVADAEDQLI